MLWLPDISVKYANGMDGDNYLNGHSMRQGYFCNSNYGPRAINESQLEVKVRPFTFSHNIFGLRDGISHRHGRERDVHCHGKQDWSKHVVLWDRLENILTLPVLCILKYYSLGAFIMGVM